MKRRHPNQQRASGTVEGTELEDGRRAVAVLGARASAQLREPEEAPIRRSRRTTVVSADGPSAALGDGPRGLSPARALSGTHRCSLCAICSEQTSSSGAHTHTQAPVS